MSQRAITPSERVLVPSGQSYRRLVKSTPVLMGALGAMLVVRNGVVGVMAASVAALALAAVAQFLRRERIVVSPAHIHAVRPIGWARKRARSDIATVVSVRVAAQAGRQAHRNLFLLDGRERLIARLKSPHWTPDDMRRLVRWLGVSPHELERTVTPKQLGRRFPRAVPLSERYPFAANAVIGLFMAAGIVGAAMLLSS